MAKRAPDCRREWVQNDRRLAGSIPCGGSKNLRLASVAATTNSDRNALQLLSKELDHMQALSNKILTARKNLSYISPDTLKKDPLDQKILKCAHSLAAMAASGEFQDDGSCR
jgi:hypothetical protein